MWNLNFYIKGDASKTKQRHLVAAQFFSGKPLRRVDFILENDTKLAKNHVYHAAAYTAGAPPSNILDEKVGNIIKKSLLIAFINM